MKSIGSLGTASTTFSQASLGLIQSPCPAKIWNWNIWHIIYCSRYYYKKISKYSPPCSIWYWHWISPNLYVNMYFFTCSFIASRNSPHVERRRDCTIEPFGNILNKGYKLISDCILTTIIKYVPYSDTKDLTCLPLGNTPKITLLRNFLWNCAYCGKSGAIITSVAIIIANTIEVILSYKNLGYTSSECVMCRVIYPSINYNRYPWGI